MINARVECDWTAKWLWWRAPAPASARDAPLFGREGACVVVNGCRAEPVARTAKDIVVTGGGGRSRSFTSIACTLICYRRLTN